MRKGRVAFGVVAGLVAAVAVTVVVLVKTVDVNAYRGLIAREVEALTGRRLTIAGDLELGLSLPLGVVVENVSLANAPWGSRPEMAHFDRLTANVQVLPLLSGEFHITRIAADGLDLLLETDRSGRGNWIFAADGSETPGDRKSPSSSGAKKKDDAASDSAAIPLVRQVDVSNLKLTYRDGGTGEVTEAGLQSLTLHADDFEDPIQLALKGSYGAAVVSVEGTLGAIARLNQSETPFPVDLAIDATGLSVTVKGTVVRPLSPQSFAVDVSASANDLGGFGVAANLPLPTLPPIDVSAYAAGTTDVISVENLEVRMAESDIAGSVQVSLQGPRPAVDAELTSKRIDLSVLGDDRRATTGERAGETRPDKSDDGRVFPDDPLPFDALTLLDATLSWSVDEWQGLALAIDNVAIDANLKNGRLVVETARADLAEGSLSLRGSIDQGAPPRVSIAGDVRQVNMGALLDMVGAGGVISGTADLDTNLSGQGRSVRALMAGLNGEARLVSREGRIESQLLGVLSTGVFEPLALLRGGDKQSLKCAVVDVRSEDGRVRTHAFVVESGNVAIIGNGGIDLATEKINMVFTPRARSLSALKLASVPVSLSGTLANPKFGVTAGDVARGTISSVARLPRTGVDAVVGLVGDVIPGISIGIDDTDYCTRALAGKAIVPRGALPFGGSSADVDTGQGADKKAKPSESIGDALKSVGKGLKNLFKD